MRISNACKIMKALSSSRPLLLLLVGLPGAGKSYFARQFSETFGAPLVASDSLRFELFETSHFTSQEQDLIKRLMERQLNELVKTKVSIIVDGICSTRQERLQLAQFAGHANYDTLTIWVQTDEPTAKKRATQRSPKRAGDELNTSLTADQFAEYAKRVQSPLPRENYVVISGKHTYTTQAKMVLRKLAAPRIIKADRAHKQETQEVRQASRVTSKSRRSVVIG